MPDQHGGSSLTVAGALVQPNGTHWAGAQALLYRAANAALHKLGSKRQLALEDDLVKELHTREEICGLVVAVGHDLTLAEVARHRTLQAIGQKVLSAERCDDNGIADVRKPDDAPAGSGSGSGSASGSLPHPSHASGLLGQANGADAAAPDAAAAAYRGFKLVRVADPPLVPKDLTPAEAAALATLESRIAGRFVPAWTAQIRASEFCAKYFRGSWSMRLHSLTSKAFKRNTGFVLFPILLALLPRYLCLFYALQSALGVFVCGLLKQLLRVPRPMCVRHTLLRPGADADGYATPSQHGVSAAVLVMAVVLYDPSWVTITLSCVALGATALSRVALGVHYIQDVLLSYVLVLGLSFGLASTWRWLAAHPIAVALTPVALLGLAGLSSLVYFVWPDPLPAVKQYYAVLKHSPRNVHKFWWASAGATGHFLATSVVYAPWWRWTRVLPEESRASGTLRLTVVSACCYAFVLYRLLDVSRAPFRTKARKRNSVWRFLEGLYYLVFNAGSILLYCWLCG